MFYIKEPNRITPLNAPLHIERVAMINGVGKTTVKYHLKVGVHITLLESTQKSSLDSVMDEIAETIKRGDKIYDLKVEELY